LADFLKILLRKLIPPVFSLEISDGKVEKRQGNATSAFIQDCSEIAGDRNILSGWIWGVRDNGIIKLDFTGNIPENAKQKFRNVWGIHKFS